MARGTVVQKIIEAHFVEGSRETGKPVAIRIDQTLTQDATGTMAYLELEAMNVPGVKTELSVSYVDHNMMQNGPENRNDHLYLQSVAAAKGVRFSPPGNGICHQVHLERFGVPGKTLIGSDSHTPTGGGIGMMAIGAGGLDVALAMAGKPFRIPYPKVVGVKLTGKLSPWCAAKDVILKLLSILTTKGNVGSVVEYFGPGVATLTVPQRATITNMGTELGATTSVFPSDEVTKAFLAAQGREQDWVEVKADDDAVYDEVIDIDLSTLEPLAAMPHMPDNVKKVSEIGEIKIDQVCIGSCTNSSLYDMLKVAAILKGKRVAPSVSLTISPGSMQVLRMLSEDGALSDILGAGARLLECACGPCIGMGQSPNSGAVSLRTFNRNFEGRSGTADAGVYLVSPEVAAASALTGVLTDPRTLGEAPHITMPDHFEINDNLIDKPASPEEAKNLEIVYGPNIKPVPNGDALPESIEAEVVLKVGDNITTDHIMPAGAKILPYRSNVPFLSNFCFKQCDENFAEHCKQAGKGIIIGGSNYGQGSSREHAALVPLYLGIKSVITKSFARIHQANLINAGIVPFTFADPADYDRIEKGDKLALDGIRETIENGGEAVLKNETKGESYKLCYSFSGRQKDIILAGGLLNYTRESHK